ncbi:MAG: helix-hairpin-helix domain-containing protein, partial [Planctomycetota bacterium]
MSTNADLATIFAEMSALLELLGANAFRVNAHANVARVLRDLTVDVAELADEKKKLVAIEGVGDGSAKKIIEYVRTGRVAEHEKLLADVPRGLLDVLALPGLGPKTVRALWEQAEITDLASLEAAIRAGTLEGLPRMGAKTIRNIEQAIEFAARAARRTRLGRALPVAESIVETLAAVDGVTRVRCAGSLRRGRETIGDVDILAAATDAATLGEAFCAMPA